MVRSPHHLALCDRRYILSDLNASSRTFSELVGNGERLPERLRAIAPQALNVSKEGFTMVLYGDEKYVSDKEEEEEASQSGGRHRVIIISEGGRPRRMTWERNMRTPTNSKL